MKYKQLYIKVPVLKQCKEITNQISLLAIHGITENITHLRYSVNSKIYIKYTYTYIFKNMFACL